MSKIKKMFNEREYVHYWFSRSKMSIKEAYNRPNLFGTLYLDYLEAFRVLKSKTNTKNSPLKKESLQYALSEYLETAAVEYRIAAISKFNTEQPTLEPLKQFIFACTGNLDEKVVNVLAHWCWQIKRKGVDAPVKHHIMPIFYGGQGAGKSQAIMKFTSPLADLRLGMDMSQLSDERLYESLSHNLIVFFDELQGVHRTDMNVLKHKITTDFNTYRKLHSHSVVNVPMACSFIGATNKKLNESLNDSTGQRRFYEIEVLPKMDWNTINTIDYRALWLGIDEKLSDGYLTGDALQAVLTAQKALVNEEEMDTYVADRNLQVVGTTQKEIAAETLYSDYRAWATDNGIQKPFTKSWFVRKLDNKGILSSVRYNERNVRVKYYIVDSSCPVVGENVDSAPPTVLPFNKR